MKKKTASSGRCAPAWPTNIGWASWDGTSVAAWPRGDRGSERIHRVLPRGARRWHRQAAECLRQQPPRVRRIDHVVDVEPARGAQRGVGALQRVRPLAMEGGARLRGLDRLELS